MFEGVDCELCGTNCKLADTDFIFGGANCKLCGADFAFVEGNCKLGSARFVFVDGDFQLAGGDFRFVYSDCDSLKRISSCMKAMPSGTMAREIKPGPRNFFHSSAHKRNKQGGRYTMAEPMAGNVVLSTCR